MMSGSGWAHLEKDMKEPCYLNPLLISLLTPYVAVGRQHLLGWQRGPATISQQPRASRQPLPCG